VGPAFNTPFDFDRLAERAGGKKPAIVVRPARLGEKLTTLDKQARELTSRHLVDRRCGRPHCPWQGHGRRFDTEGPRPQNLAASFWNRPNFDFRSIRRTMESNSNLTQ